MMSLHHHRVAALVVALLLSATALAGCGGGATSGTDSGGAGSSGEALVRANCSRCHPPERALDANKDAAAWSATIARMKTHGLEISAQDEAAIVEYLSTK